MANRMKGSEKLKRLTYKTDLIPSISDVNENDEYICDSNNYCGLCDKKVNECANFISVITKLEKYEDTGLEPEEILQLHKSCMIDVGQIVFVITKYGMHEFEVITCTVNRKTVKTRKSFAVSGRYKNGNYYNGTFVDSSIGKNVFLNEKEAMQECKKRNK